MQDASCRGKCAERRARSEPEEIPNRYECRIRWRQLFVANLGNKTQSMTDFVGRDRIKVDSV